MGVPHTRDVVFIMPAAVRGGKQLKAFAPSGRLLAIFPLP